MFKLQPNPTFPATVQITVPGGDSLPLAVVFKHKGAAALQSFLNGAQGRTDESLIAEMLDSIPATEKSEGQSDLEFLSALVDNYPASRSDLLRTYLCELTESRVKN